MSNRKSVVIIGGGVMGVSLLYHLVKRGWQDVMLVEKNQLTAGSTWHAAGLCTHFAHNPTIQELRATSVRLYRDILPEETGESVGFHPCGALRITCSEERMHEFRQVQALGEFTRYPFNLLSPEELKEIYPLTTTDGIVGAIHEPWDGHVDPTLATNAMAEQARAGGAEIQRNNPVRDIRRELDHWHISAEQGDLEADHIVNAAGTWCREIGDLMGVDLPVVPILHQYLVTDSVPEIQQRIESGLRELPIIRDPEESWYLRQERDGYIIGPYEKDGQPWSIDGVPESFGMELLPPDIDRIEHILEMAMARVPALESASLKTVVNGPITFTPDANPLVGPAFNLRNAWLLTGSSMGVMEGGGAGKFLADWMTDGHPPMDALAIDSRRFGGYTDRNYRIRKAVECFGLQFGVHYPYEERPAARPGIATPLYETTKSAGSIFGFAYGFERPNYFLNTDSKTEPPLTFNQPGWLKSVRDECHRVQHLEGFADLSVFSKYEVTGPNAGAFMNALGANAPPKTIGRLGLTHALTPSGGVASEFAIAKLNENHYYLTSAAAARRHDLDLLRKRSSQRNVSIKDITEQRGVLGIMGPRSAWVMENACDIDLEDFPWLSHQSLNIQGIDVIVMRVSYVGECGFELHMPMQDLKTIHDHLVGFCTEDHGYYGAYAMNSMRLEKGYRAWGMDLTTERTPDEAGLSYLVKPDDRDFIGREALLNRRNDEAWSMVLLELEYAGDKEPFAAHPVFVGDEAVGIITSAATGHRTDKRLALAYLRPEARHEQTFRVRVIDQYLEARVLSEPPYDPTNQRMKL